jgi:hypothetical protein
VPFPNTARINGFRHALKPHPSKQIRLEPFFSRTNSN